MQLNVQKRLAADVGKCSVNRVRFTPESLSDVKEAITKADIRNLIKQGVIVIKPKRGTSRARIRQNIIQKRKGRRKGFGSRKGSSKARRKGKIDWIKRIRLQRKTLRALVERAVISSDAYRDLYHKSSGGFFRSKRHILLYIEERGLKLKPNENAKAN